MLLSKILASQDYPVNIGFEKGTLEGWNLFTGSCCPAVAQNKGTSPNDFKIVSDTGKDIYGGFPTVPPGGGKYALKLGNASNGYKAQRVRYYLHIPDQIDNYCLNYKYAFVFADKPHSIDVQPRFQIAVYDSASNAPINCENQLLIPYFYSPGVKRNYNNFNICYKGWTDATLNLSGLSGKTVAIDFLSAGCDEGGHFGYAYFDIDCGYFSISSQVCSSSASATLKAPAGYASYDWRDSAMLRISSGSSNSLTVSRPLKTSRYYVIIGRSNYPDCIDTLMAIIEATEVKSAFKSDDTMQCLPGNMFSFVNVSSVNKGQLKFLWDFGDSGSSTAYSPSRIYLKSGNYKVSLYAFSEEDCRDTFYSQVAVKNMPIAKFTALDTEQCLKGNYFSFMNVSGQYTYRNFRWDFGDGQTDTTYPAGHVYQKEGVYTTRLIAKDFELCSDTFEQKVTIHPNPILGFNRDTACLGDTIVLHAYTQGFTGKIKSYYWDLGDNITDTGHVVSHEYTSPGKYAVMLGTETDKGCLDTLSIADAVLIYDLPEANFAFDNILDSFPLSIWQFNNLSSDHILRYDWKFGTSDSSSVESPMAIFKDTGWQEIRLRITDQWGCIDESIKWVGIKHTYSLFVPNAFSPNSDGINEVFRAVGLNIRNYRMEVFNLWGEKLFSTELLNKSWDGTYKGEPCQQGVYLCVIKATSFDGQLHHLQNQVTLLR